MKDIKEMTFEELGEFAKDKDLNNRIQQIDLWIRSTTEWLSRELIEWWMQSFTKPELYDYAVLKNGDKLMILSVENLEKASPIGRKEFYTYSFHWALVDDKLNDK